MGGKSGYKRRIYLIDREFQFKYLVTWLLLVLSLVGGIVLATLSLFFFFRGSLFQYSIEINAGLAVLFTGLSLYYMVHHSHRIAGPAYRLEYVIRELARGEYDLDRRLYLRRKDYLKQVADALNSLIEVRARERGHARLLLAGMSELDAAIQRTSGLTCEMKDLSKLMFAEVVDLVQSFGGPASEKNGLHVGLAEPSVNNCVTPPGLVTEQSVHTLGMNSTEDTDEEDVSADEDGSVNEYQRASQGYR